MSNTPHAFCCWGVSPFAGSEDLPCYHYLQAFHDFGCFGQSMQAWIRASATQKDLVMRLIKRHLFGRTAETSVRWFEVFTAIIRDDWGTVLKTEYFFREASADKIAGGEYNSVPGTEMTFDCTDHGFRFEVDAWEGKSGEHVEFWRWWSRWSGYCRGGVLDRAPNLMAGSMRSDHELHPSSSSTVTRLPESHTTGN